MEHTSIPGESNPCECPKKPSISFLDTSLIVKEEKIYCDLYKKSADRNQYLLPSNCHPSHCHQNIPFSLALRIIRICSKETERDLRLSELKEMLIARDYKKGLINAAIEKALKIPKCEAIKKSCAIKNL